MLLLAALSSAALAEGLMDLLKPDASRKPVQEKFVGGDPLAKQKVAIIKLKGIILASQVPGTGQSDMVEALRVQLRYAAEDDDLKGILLEIDTPGGGVTASDILHHAVRQVRTKGKPVVALMEDLAASGGYFVAAAANRIIAHPSTITGSIGVIVKQVNVEGLFSKIGLKDVTITSERTPFKDMLSMTREMSEDEKRIMVELIDEMYDRFVEVVAEGRGLPEEKVRELADGRVYSATRAKGLGLIDAIGFRDDALRAVSELAGLTQEPKIVEYRKTFDLTELFSAGLQGSGGTLEGRFAERLLSLGATPQFLYLWEP